MKNQMVEKSLILYIDILGYKNQIYEFKDENQFLNLIYSAIEEVLKMRNYFGIKNLKYNVFSDNLIFASSINFESDENHRSNIEKILRLASVIQSIFISKSILIRGAITIGKIFIDNSNFVFGTGLVEAYKLEESEAKYPRIIMSSELEALILNLKVNNLYYLIDIDHKLIVNYLGYYAELTIKSGNDGELKNSEEQFLNFILNHKHILLNLLNVFSEEEKVCEKIRWSLMYHNSFCYLVNLDKNISSKVKGDKSMFLVDSILYNSFLKARSK